MKYLIGIDFGTTTTAISCTRISATFEPELIEIDNQRTTESVLRLTDGNEIEIIGLRAWEEIGDAPERTFYEFKLKVASKEILQLPEGPGTARDIGIIFLRNLREKIERGLFGNSPLKEIDAKEGIKTVIGHPSGWSEAQRKATISMAEEAGFPNVEGCEEPIGALYYHYYLGDLSLDKVQKVLVYDFGGGTSDVAIISTTGAEEPRVIATSGIADLGGRNFDEIIASAWEEKLLQETYKTKMSNRDKAWVRRHSRRLKEKLSIAVEGKGNSASETIPILQCKGDRDTFSMDVTSFETMNADLITRFSEPLWDAMSGASLDASDIDIVILTGGSGRFYFAREKLKEMFPNAQILRSANPQEAVSKGLALYSKVLVCGKEQIRSTSESSDQAVIKTPYGNKSNSSSSDEIYPMLPDPYTSKKTGKKINIFKICVISFFIVAIFALFSVSGNQTNNSLKDTGGTAESASDKTTNPSILEKTQEQINKNTLNEILYIYEKLDKAQDDKNISLITAIQKELSTLDVKDSIPELWEAKQSLSAYAQTAIDYHKRYNKHPYDDMKYFSLTTSKAVDAVYQKPLIDGIHSIDARTIMSDYHRCLFNINRAKLAIGLSTEDYLTRYSIKINSYNINTDIAKRETNYCPWEERLTEGDPDVKIAITTYENEDFDIIKVFPRDQRSYADTPQRAVSESFVWYTSSSSRLFIFMIDIDTDSGELLGYAEIPNSNYSGWLKVGPGSEINLNIIIENTK